MSDEEMDQSNPQSEHGMPLSSLTVPSQIKPHGVADAALSIEVIRLVYRNE